MSADFWAGYVSGAAGIIIGNPLDLIKVRLQAGTQITTTGSGPTALPGYTAPSSYTGQFNNAGSLIRGATAPILGYGALNALLFMTYNRTTLLLNPSATAPPTLWTAWIAGAVGGLATWVVSTPTELVKCRAQMSNSTSSLRIAQEVIRTQGLKGLYFGGTVTALRDSIGYGFYFWSYEITSRFLASQPGVEKSAGGEAAKVFLCGGLAGVVTWASIFPLDVIKTRVQTQVLRVAESAPLLGTEAVLERPRIGALEMSRTMFKNEGTSVFFRGLMVCSIRAFVVNAAQWAVYEWIMHQLVPVPSTGTSSLSGTN